ncbi:urease accessory protein UreD [Martelella alba]|uniref:Urease accessory protein UreD n=1 Tax=Martelella alba TaxID=2590451 RepID=A0ABY2SPR7_9HYPH|nr:urease accessory protein UreD [Martelella alba]TKI06690.1 urease accessory protein UreD [Martelella alba]
MPFATDDYHPDGWLGRLELEFVRRATRTELSHRRHIGPFTVQRAFYPEADFPHLYLLHPPGGVVGGDRLELAVRMGPASHALLTMPGATKFYRSGGARAQVLQRFSLAQDSVLEWLPQGNILFPAADVSLHNEFCLQPGARVLGYETFCLGRPASGLDFHQGRLDSVLSIKMPDSPGLFERLRIEGGRLSKVADNPLCGTFFAAPCTEAMLDCARALVQECTAPMAGATLVDSLLVVRALDHDNQRLTSLLQGLWAELRPALLGRPAIAPRIWST